MRVGLPDLPPRMVRGEHAGAALMAYTQDRESFERDMFRPPFMARMMEMAGRYARCTSGRLDSSDKEVLFRTALDEFWETRGNVCNSNDVYRVWELALKAAATSRERWLVWSQVQLKHVWVPGKALGSRDAFFTE